jgi:hypothetical protein
MSPKTYFIVIWFISQCRTNLYGGIVVLSANMTLDKRQELERLRAAILQEQDTDLLIKLLEELNEAVSKRRNAVIIASRQRGASVLNCKESQGLPKAVAKNFD